MGIAPTIDAISATDIDFGSVAIGLTVSHTVDVANTGNAAFTLTTAWLLSDTTDFSVTEGAGVQFPLSMQPSTTQHIAITFHPRSVGQISGRVDWKTDIDQANLLTGKSYSMLQGFGIKNLSVAQKSGNVSSFEFSPNPVYGSSTTATCRDLSGTSTLAVFDILGREVFSTEVISSSAQVQIPVRDFQSGVYYIRLTSHGTVETKKMEVVK